MIPTFIVHGDRDSAVSYEIAAERPEPERPQLRTRSSCSTSETGRTKRSGRRSSAGRAVRRDPSRSVRLCALVRFGAAVAVGEPCWILAE